MEVQVQRICITVLCLLCTGLLRSSTNGMISPADCLHRYLEKDFGNLDLSSHDQEHGHHSRHAAHLDFESRERECLNWQSTLNCYDNVQKVRNQHLYRRLVVGLHETKSWACDGDVAQYEDFLAGIQCLKKLTEAKICVEYRHVKNKWQKLLRLEFGSEICEEMVTEHRCLLEKIPLYCPGGAVSGYNHTMEIVLKNWCAGVNCGTSVITMSIATILSFAAAIIFYQAP